MSRSARIAAASATTAILASLTVLAGPDASNASPSDAARPTGVCEGVTSCHRVARVDVTGDGRADSVGWRQLNEDSVQIRVLTAGGKLLTHRVNVRLWWGGGAWAGAAHVDGRAGAELLVGSEQGAHTPMYTMLTYRGGALVVEKSPSPLSGKWQVDSAYGDVMGWRRHVLPDGRTEMAQTIAVRDEGGRVFTGHRVTYAWSAAGWSRVATASVRYPNPAAAAAVAGFHVSGLQRFPGVG